MYPSAIIWDLETATDLARYAAVNGLEGKSDSDLLEELGDKFQKHIYHSILCIGAVIVRREGDHWVIDSIGAPHVGERSEKELITAFVRKIAELKPQLITFNGNSFDLPVLRYRAMIHEVSAPGLSMRPYFKRFTNDALDLCDELSSFQSNGKAKLNEICKAMGLAGKPDGIHGGEVGRYFREGRIKEIAEYCESDVVNTYRLWLRYELFCGTLSQSGFASSEKALARYLATQTNTKPHLAECVGKESTTPQVVLP